MGGMMDSLEAYRAVMRQVRGGSAWDALHAGGEAELIALAERSTHGQAGSAVL